MTKTKPSKESSPVAKQPVKQKTNKPTAAKKPTIRRKKIIAAPTAVSDAVKKSTPNQTDESWLLVKPQPSQHNYWNWLLVFSIGALGLLLLSTAAVVLISPLANRQPITNNLNPTPTPVLKQNLTALAPLTGLPCETSVVSRRPWAVVVENFPTVRPQSGLSFADLIIETPTEGGITRFLAFFQSELPTSLLGPIRSARSYFNDWARAWSPLFSHSGGSTKALQQLAKGYGAIQDVNEFSNGPAYQRDERADPPHNLFTTATRFFSYVQQKGWPSQLEVPPLTFTPITAAGALASSITVPYQPEDYSARFDYLPNQKVYQRYTNDEKQIDLSTGQPIQVTNFIVLVTTITPLPNDELKRTEIKTLGSGTALLFTQGQEFIGQWHKDKLDNPLTFTDADGHPLPLQPGKTWISVIDSSLQKSLTVNSPTKTGLNVQ